MKEELIEVIKQFIAKRYGYEDFHAQTFELSVEDFNKFTNLILYIKENF